MQYYRVTGGVGTLGAPGSIKIDTGWVMGFEAVCEAVKNTCPVYVRPRKRLNTLRVKMSGNRLAWANYLATPSTEPPVHVGLCLERADEELAAELDNARRDPDADKDGRVREYRAILQLHCERLDASLKPDVETTEYEVAGDGLLGLLLECARAVGEHHASRPRLRRPVAGSPAAPAPPPFVPDCWSEGECRARLNAIRAQLSRVRGGLYVARFPSAQHSAGYILPGEAKAVDGMDPTTYRRRWATLHFGLAEQREREAREEETAPTLTFRRQPNAG